MIPEMRYTQIIAAMQADSTVKNSELVENLGVSQETVRRDLNHLERMGLIRRTAGGAILAEKAVSPPDSYTSFDHREHQNITQKIEVANLAANFVSEGQSLALDSGTTALELAKVLKRRFKTLTIVTNSLPVANELADAQGFTVILTGGIIKRDERSLVSEMATLIFQQLSINIFFMTTCGVSADRGVTYQRMDEMSVQMAMLDASDKAVLIADSSKIGVNSLVKMCDLDRISMLITDKDLSEKHRLELSRLIKVVTAKGDE